MGFLRIASAKGRAYIAHSQERSDDIARVIAANEANRASRLDLRITTADGDYWHTGFNGTLDEARAYFMGQVFEGRDERPMAPVVSVEVVR